MSYDVYLVVKSWNISIHLNWFKLLLFWNKIVHVGHKK